MRHAQQDHAAVGIGKRRYLCRQRIRALHILFEPTAAVLAERHVHCQFVQRHREKSDSLGFQCRTDAVYNTSLL